MKFAFKCLLTVTFLLTLSLAALACSKGSPVNKVKLVEIALTDESYAFGVDKNQPELLPKVNELITKIKDDGTFDQIYERYFGGGTPQPVVSAKPDSAKEQLVVATNAAFEPFEYMEGDKYLGIDMEVAALLAEHLGRELVISNMDFDAVCLSVGQGKADIAMAGLTVNENRKEFVAFSDSYYSASQMIIAREDDKAFDGCKSTAEAEKVLASLPQTARIGVQTGTTAQFYVEGDEDWQFDGFPVECVGYNSGALAVQDLLNGNIQYVIIDEAPASFIVSAINEYN